MLGFEYSVLDTAWREELIDAGFVRVVAQSQLLPLEDAAALQDVSVGDEVMVVMDRLVTGKTAPERLVESIESALEQGEGRCVVLIDANDEGVAGSDVEINSRRWQAFRYSRSLSCGACDRSFSEPTPQLFNFNSPLGACPECEGFGSLIETDMDLVVPDRTKSLRQGAVAPWNSPAYAHELEELIALAPDLGIPPDIPYSELTDEHLNVIQHGSKPHDFGGLDGFFAWLERRKYKMHLRVFLSRWRSYRPCNACDGARLKPDALVVRLGDKNIAELCRLRAEEAKGFLRDLPLSETEGQVGLVMLDQIAARLGYLVEVGLGYLPLDRSLRTLSSGEAQRVAMTSTLGSNLVDMLYVLDEPTAGLHAVDVGRLTGAIGRLRDRGNSVIVVDHEEEVIAGADLVVEFGPGAGARGDESFIRGRPVK